MEFASEMILLRTLDVKARFPGNPSCVLFSLSLLFKKWFCGIPFVPLLYKILFYLAKDIRLKVTPASFEDNKGI